MDEVDTANHPLAEAAFLNQANNISTSYTGSSTDVDFGFGSVEINTSSLGLGAEFWTSSKLYISANFSLNDAEVAGQDADAENSFNASIGYAPSNNTLITAGITDDGEESDPTLAVKHIMNASSGNAINLEAAALLAEDTVLSVGADYYIDPHFRYRCIINNSRW